MKENKKEQEKVYLKRLMPQAKSKAKKLESSKKPSTRPRKSGKRRRKTTGSNNKKIAPQPQEVILRMPWLRNARKPRMLPVTTVI